MLNAMNTALFRVISTALFTVTLAACDGDNQGLGNIATAQCDSNSTASNPDTSQVTISGQATFDWIPPQEGFSGSGDVGALDYDATQKVAIKRATLELLDSSNQIINTTTTDDAGQYSILSPMNTAVKIRILAEVANDNYQYSVVDNTSDNSLYALAGNLINSNTCDSTRDLNAASGWNSADEAYSDTRSAAPFAILNSISQAMTLLTNADPGVTLPELVLHWSPDNIAASGNKADGQIVTSHYDNQNRIYILGHENNDTDEYDRGVIQHEFAHFLEDNLWRSDNIGGSHSLASKLDIRLAFGEGFANAFSSMAGDTKNYNDTFGSQQQRAASIDLESGAYGTIGWYSERSNGEIIYDLFDSDNEGDDSLSLGFGPIYDTLSSPSYIGNTALTSIYLFTSELKKNLNNAEVDALDNILLSHSINGQNAFGDGETNDGGDPNNLPVYRQLELGDTINLCTSKLEGEYSGVDTRRFLRFTVDSQQTVSISMSRTRGNISDPDARLYNPDGSEQIINSSSGDNEVFSKSMAGDYVLEVFAYRNTDQIESSGGSACFDVSVEGV